MSTDNNQMVTTDNNQVVSTVKATSMENVPEEYIKKLHVYEYTNEEQASRYLTLEHYRELFEAWQEKANDSTWSKMTTLKRVRDCLNKTDHKYSDEEWKYVCSRRNLDDDTPVSYGVYQNMFRDRLVLLASEVLQDSNIAVPTYSATAEDAKVAFAYMTESKADELTPESLAHIKKNIMDYTYEDKSKGSYTFKYKKNPDGSPITIRWLSDIPTINKKYARRFETPEERTARIIDEDSATEEQKATRYKMESELYKVLTIDAFTWNYNQYKYL